jgi:putative methionine-R-sulfoxide reductase with GAF domain
MDAERVLHSLGRTLEKERHRLRASSCTFYVRDKFWKDEFRLAASAGIRYHEPMHGMLYPASSRHRVLDGGIEQYIPNHAAVGSGSTDGEDHKLDDIPATTRHLFADFIRREGVAASARLMHETPGQGVDAVLFVNYRQPTTFDDKRKHRLWSLLSSLVTNLATVREAINVTDIKWLSEAARVVSPPLSVVNVDLKKHAPEKYFTLVLESTLAALDVKDGFGMVHLYDAENDMLRLSAVYGDVENVDRARNHSVARGEGVVSWVVHRRRTLLIPDLAASDYGTYVHRSIKDSTQSELAFPIIAGGELIGVICLESARLNAFVPHHVRSVWYVANRCAIFYQLHREARMTSTLLDLCSEATTGEIPGRKALERLAIVAQDNLGGSFSDISCFDHDTSKFILWASSYGSVSQVRDDGWTDYCRRTKVPIWITHGTSEGGCPVREWRADKWAEPASADLSLPPNVNPASLTQDVECELGLPIIVRDECVGVAWVKYKRKRLEPPQAGLMSLALGFASHAGLVVDSIRHIEDMRSLASVASVANHIREEMHGRWAQHHSSVVDMEVVSVPYRARQGGDMYARKCIDSSTVGVLLLDGQGHAIPGLLHMLPFVSAFEACWNSYAPAHVMSQLRAAAKTAGVRANAVYWLVTRIEERRWLLVASAGNVFLIHLFYASSKGGWDYTQLPHDGGPELGGLVSQPQLEQRVVLNPGDVIVAITDGVAQQDEVPQVARIARDLLDDDRERSTDSIARLIVERMRDYRRKPWDDDVTVIVGRVT